jgi:hypothetical protein
VHLDRGDDSGRRAPSWPSAGGHIAHQGTLAPVQASKRWPVERTHAWGNAFGKLRWCTERHRRVVECSMALAHATIIVVAGPPGRGPATAGRVAQADVRNRPGCQRCYSAAA